MAANNEIINDDSIKMATAAANSDSEGVRTAAQDIWSKHPGDSNYWAGVREGANHILREGYAQKTSSVMDALRDKLPLANEGSSKFAKAQIEHDGSINFSMSATDAAVQRANDVVDPKAAAEREQAKARN